MKINFWYNYDKTIIEVYPKTGNLALDNNPHIQEIPDELYERYVKVLKEYKEVQEELERLNDEYHNRGSEAFLSEEEISEQQSKKGINEWWVSLKTFLIGDKK